MKRSIIPLIIILLGQTIYAQQKFNLISNNKAGAVYYQGNEKVVNTAIDMLISDSKLICDQPFSLNNELNNNTIVVGIPDQEPDIKELVDRFKLETADLAGKWDAYKIQAVESNGDNYLFILGSNPRGVAYGILELSRQMGISPWVWWADVVPDKKENVTIMTDEKVHAPSVQYRGFFLNDEDWALMPWSTRTFEPTPVKGAIGPKTYAKICELLLRLRANTLWPAMHECTVPFYFTEGNKDVSDKYGIIMGTSHCEPMMRTNTGEWDNAKYGSYNFLTNRENILSYWNERLADVSKTENIFTMGMRGIHDGRMQGVKTIEGEAKILQEVINAQRELLKNSGRGDVSSIPQAFIPYKEVLKAYDAGVELPEDITLVWCDDNHGYIMRLSDPEEQKRVGGGGVYYHVSYWGKPHDYLWLGSTQPALIYTEMKRAWDNNARRMWILNVGDIKPNEYLTEFFLDMAWDIDAFAGDKIYAHQRKWLHTTFQGKATDKINRIMKQYYHLSGHRKPEHMAWNKVEDWELRRQNPTNRQGLQPVKDSELSPVHFGDEMERRIQAFNSITLLSEEIFENEIPNELKPAYFQLIHYQVAASSAMSRKILYAQKSRLYAETNVELAGYYAQLATDAYNEITALDYTYNRDMQNGKWNLMMDMKPRDLPVFQQPVLPDLPKKVLCPTNNPAIPKVPALPITAGTPVEGDRMVALNACDFINNLQTEVIEGLGHSGKAVRLQVAKKMNVKQPHLKYKVFTTSKGSVKIKVGTIPMHPVHGNSKMRYAIVIDNQKPIVVSTSAEFLSDKWAENVLRNQSLTITEASIPEAGEHTICIYALDEELLVDQLMMEFDLGRKHYLIPVK